MGLSGDADEFERLRPRLVGIAYRMTGSSADANDVVQDAWLRWSADDRTDVENVEAFLVRTVSRLSIDKLKSATARRVDYVGPYLPEPLLSTEPATSTEELAELADSLTFSFLVLLDSLNEVERAVLLLHDVFGYPFDEVAVIVERSPAAVRQVAKRARDRLRSPAAPAAPSAVAAPSNTHPVDRHTLEQLLVGIGTGDVDLMLGILAPDVVSITDGGKERHAARRPIVGVERNLRFWTGLGKRADQYLIDITEVNGAPGLLITELDGTPYLTGTVELNDAGQVVRIYAQLNPAKLSTVIPPG